MLLSTSLNVLFDPARISLEDSIERAAAAGFDNVDFNFTDWCFMGSPFVESGWEQWIKSVKSRADSLGVRFNQSHGPIFNKWASDEHTKQLTDLSHRSLIAAGMLEIPWVVFEPETASGAWDTVHIQSLIQRNVDWFSELLVTAEQHNTGLALENVTDIYAQTGRGASRWIGSVPAELISLVDAFDSTRVGVCWDTGHALIQKVEQGGAIRAFGSRLKALHIQDNDGHTDQHLAPYYGQVQWSEIMAALHNIDFQGDFTFEIHNFVRPLPDELRDEALRLAVRIGRSLIKEFESHFN